MDEMKLRFVNAVAGQLSAAPDTTAKTELVEELSENLYRRYQDLTASGVEAEAAFRRAMDDLGDVDELLEYLKGLSPDGPRAEADAHGGSGHEWDGWPGKDEVNELIDNVGGIVRSALNQANNALRQAKDVMRRAEQESWRSPEDFDLHFDEMDDLDGDLEDLDKELEHLDDEPERPEAEDGEKKDHGWGFSAELDTDAGRFFAGGGPKDKSAVYGFGYDKDKGGFYTRWGGDKETVKSPTFCGVDTWFENEGSGCVISTSKPLKGVDIQSVSGDVTVRLLDEEDAAIRLGGDVEKLEVKVTEDGVLAIRQGKTVSSWAMFTRGLTSANVELYLPRRKLEFLQVSVGNGDIDLGEGLELDRLSVKGGNSDLRGDLGCCGRLFINTASGDIELGGLSGTAKVQAAGADVRLSGRLDQVMVSSASGDVEVDGEVRAAKLSSISGDVRLGSSVMPERADLSSTSGDCELRIPDTAPFTAKFGTTTGEVSSDFFRFTGSGRNLSFDYQGGGTAYHLSSVSGDLDLKKY